MERENFTNDPVEEIRGYSRIVVETDEENPETVAVISADTIDPAEGFRVRLRPLYD